jgi:hypothetical protein
MKKDILAAMILAGVATTSPAATSDQNWDSRFVRAPGLDGPVFTLLAVGTNLYVGGEFATAGRPGTSGVARWDGTHWNSVGGGINGTVFTLATDGTNLYAGGSFDSAGSASATNIAKWNGSSWSSLGALFLPNSLNPERATVHALLWDQGLWAGGMFTQAGTVAATNVARWDGQTWQGLGDGLGVFGPFNDAFQVFALTKHHNELYAGGLFHRSGEIGVTNLARWTGTSWVQVGGGVSGGSFGVYWFDETGGYILSGAVYTLNSNASGLLVGGDFTEAGGTIATNIARWNGTNWTAIGGACDGDVARITSDGSDQLVLGQFGNIGGIPANGIARWDGTTWSQLGPGVIAAGFAAARLGTNLFVGGNFQIAGGQSAGHAARWDGQNWQALNPGEGTAPSDWVGSLAFGPRGNLYAAGGFATVGKVRANRVARYDGTNWSALGNGFPERNVQAVATVGTNVYVSGYFTRPAAGITNLARWNESDWVALGSGLGREGYDPTIAGLAAGTTNLFVSGYFKTAGGIPVTNLARWDGSQWHSLNYIPSPYDPFTSARSIDAIAAQDDDLFICERTSTYVGGNSAILRVRRWQSGDWTQVGADTAFATSPYIQSMTWAGTNLYVTGHFIVTNGFFATNLLCWNGVAWTGVNHPFMGDDLIAPATTDGTNLFVAINSMGDPVTEIKLARWDGSKWTTLGTGITSDRPWLQVSSLAVRGRDLFVGGYFSAAGGKPADNLALWHDFPEVTLAGRGWQPGGVFGLRVLGGKNQPVQVQTSTNLNNWQELGPQLPNSDAFDFEAAATPPAEIRYYRLRLIP